MATQTLPATRRTGKAGSTIFLKTLMAVTGIIFILFVLAHMYGNLKLFSGERSFNTYAEHLRTIGEPMLPRRGLLTILEVVLGLSLILHVYSAVALWRRANEARPQKYAVKKAVSQSLSSKTMRWGGLFLLLFVIWHLLQFTIVKFNVGSGGGAFQHNPFQLTVHAFQVWWLTLLYILAMIALGFHLHHGVWSAAQTLGWTTTPRARRIAKTAGLVIALVVAIGFILPPLFILFGVIK
ncbi:succinate dehydrogenase cytochrome b subunit [Calidifontibacter sp. DB0510]|uniref:Succinate dehydrogenase cytochrome b subunit n=1 Tax=Metallococcus carri TaxID=1656884 RepID=A0A967B3E5_9MICO|nr:succinate dehydrogenase cytochrome b subunit [Metallococcus carri]NHN56560.1 succinate dehydrogenase cytochrome b subunit [Metallococcus carri]NOP38859.1 succinate dehydrogenase cytochrome b subunit [Calidifontibacter sp. DB2511S]